jgi:hypothetical protein
MVDLSRLITFVLSEDKTMQHLGIRVYLTTMALFVSSLFAGATLADQRSR